MGVKYSAADSAQLIQAMTGNLQAANQVIENNQNRKPKELWTENEAGDKITYYCAASGYEESRYVMRTIQRMVNFDGYDYSDFAVL